MKALASLILLTLCMSGQAKVFTKCELATTLKNGGLDGYYATAWPTVSVTRDYGVFQMNSYWWCNDGRTSGAVSACNISCSSLMDDSISDDITCAKRVVSHGRAKGVGVRNNPIRPPSDQNKPQRSDPTTF
uniref:Lysozyme n=1 Tax=Leptobrachium leishanense TaxID=445787 RepID=A0A8C5MI23_9ANUR